MSFSRLQFLKQSSFWVVSGFVILIAFGVKLALDSNLFLVKEVKVLPLSPGYPLTQEQVIKLGRLSVNRSSLFDYDVRGVEDRLKGHPWVKGVSVRKEFPSRIVVQIIERKPIAVFSQTSFQSQARYLDEDGSFFEDQSIRYAQDLPLLQIQADESADEIFRLAEFIRTWFDPKFLPGVTLSSVSLDKKLGLRATVLIDAGKNRPPMRTTLELGLHVDEALQIPREPLNQVMRHLSQNSLRASKIWLGDGKKIVVKVSRGS